MTVNAPPRRRVLLNAWTTPIYTAMVDGYADHNPILRDLILKAEPEDPDAANFGGIAAIKSSQDILCWDHPSIDWLKAGLARAEKAMMHAVLGDAAQEVVANTLAEGWAVVYREGGSLRPHTHHDSVWSAVYYVSSGSDPDSEEPEGEAGYLQMLDPRPAAIARGTAGPVLRIAPVPGRIVAFPGWLPHQVSATVHGEGLRICTAFNIAYDKETWTGMR